MIPLSYIIAAAVVAIVVLTAVITVVSVCCLSRKKRQGNKWGIVMSVVLMGHCYGPCPVVLMRVFTSLSETSTLFSELLLTVPTIIILSLPFPVVHLVLIRSEISPQLLMVQGSTRPVKSIRHII